MSSKLQFPNAETVRTSILNDPLIDRYYKEKGVVEIIADLAAKRFANIAMTKAGLETRVFLILNDLERGKDGFNGEPLLKLEKLFPHVPVALVRESLSRDITAILIRCATKNPST